MTIDHTAASAANPFDNTDASPSKSLLDSTGQGMFLRLLVAQLSNQDPLSPQDPTEFVSQLAEFSALEQLLLMNESLASIEESLAAAAAPPADS